MDVELQVIKNLARDDTPTVRFIDSYCAGYKDLFPEVRSYECFKYLHHRIISPIKRKPLPEIAKVVGVYSAQSLHHFIPFIKSNKRLSPGGKVKELHLSKVKNNKLFCELIIIQNKLAMYLAILAN